MRLYEDSQRQQQARKVSTGDSYENMSDDDRDIDIDSDVSLSGVIPKEESNFGCVYLYDYYCYCCRMERIPIIRNRSGIRLGAKFTHR